MSTRPMKMILMNNMMRMMTMIAAKTMIAVKVERLKESDYVSEALV